MNRKICVITGSRAEYGLLKPIILGVEKRPSLELLLMVTGMHFSKEFGRTVDLIKKDGLRIAYRVKMHPKEDNAESMSIAIGRGIIEITKAFKKNRPNIVLVLGDRIEALAGAIAGAYLNIPIAHIHGGDISKAGLDESARHAITKMSHIHFAASGESMKRILNMGEKKENVFLVGSPGLDTILSEPLLSRGDLDRICNLDLDKPFFLLLQHSVTTQIDEAKKQIKETLGAIKKLKIHTIAVYPNSDAGGRAIINEINRLRDLQYIKIFKSLPHNLYLSLLKHAAVVIGNSSSGIIEAASFNTPVVNIGIRQQGRERTLNVIDTPHKRQAIVTAVKKALYNKGFNEKLKRCKNPYGDGHASERIIKVLNRIPLNSKLLQKQLNY